MQDVNGTRPQPGNLTKHENWIEDPHGYECDGCGAVAEVLAVSYSNGRSLAQPKGSDIEKQRCPNGCFEISI